MNSKDHNAHGGWLKNLMHEKDEHIADKLIYLPRVNLTERQLCDLELLMNGGFSPLEGFLEESDYNSVVERMRLANGKIWPIPIVFDVSEDASYKNGEEIILCDQVGKPLAFFFVSSVYRPDKEKEAHMVYGTTDALHPGVKYLLASTGNIYLGGKIIGISFPEKYDFHDLRHSPAELREFFEKQKWNVIVGFQTRNPLHRAHFELIKRAAKAYNANVLLHPVVGLTKEGDIDYITRVRCYKKLHENYMRDFAVISLLPLAMRMAGPREAVWHAIIRKNYGCTHFIVGRDHAGPGNNSEGKAFYGPYDAQHLAKTVEREIGITIIPFSEMVYVVDEDRYIPSDEVQPHHTVKNISGTQIRKMLVSNEEIPEWFSFPEIIAELKKGVRRERENGFTLFFTGLSGAGKSTIANIVYTKLFELQDRKITLLDGDIVRQHLSKGLGFSKEDRIENIKRIGFVAGEVTKHGGVAICAAIAPYEEVRNHVRRQVGTHGLYIEVYVATPIEVCRERDVKGLYKKAEAGQLKNFTGIDDPYEVPERPEIILDASKKSAPKCADEIINYLESKNLI